MKKMMGVLPLLASSVVLAGDATVRLSDDAVSLLIDPAASATNSVQFGLLFNDDDDAYMLSGGLFANGQREALTGRLGAKAYYADLDEDSGYGIALGGDLNFQLSQELTLNAGLFYGPDALTFSDLDGYEEWFVRIHYRLFDTASLGAGYGSLEIESDDGVDIEVDEGLFFEMRLKFQ